MVARRNARHRARIDAERAALLPLPPRRVQDFEHEQVWVTSHSGFTLRRVFKALWPQFTATADREGWPAARLLAALTEHEIADRARRRFQRHLRAAQLPHGKTLEAFDFNAVPMLSKAYLMALSSGDRWLDEGANVELRKLLTLKWHFRMIYRSRTYHAEHSIVPQ